MKHLAASQDWTGERCGDVSAVEGNGITMFYEFPGVSLSGDKKSIVTSSAVDSRHLVTAQQQLKHA